MIKDSKTGTFQSVYGLVNLEFPDLLQTITEMHMHEDG